jgi:hypothetical protein
MTPWAAAAPASRARIDARGEGDQHAERDRANAEEDD